MMSDPLKEKNGGVVDLEALVAPMLETHKSQVNQSYEWRRKNLLLLQKMILNHKQEWVDALAKDLGKIEAEAWSYEMLLMYREIQHIIKSLWSWMKPEPVPSPIHSLFAACQVRRIPLRPPGVLIIGASNFPVQLVLSPLAGCLAAGNPAVVKTSNLCPATSDLMCRLVNKYFDKGAVQALEGGVPVVTALLQQEWGKIVFTGSQRVGRIVSEAAAKTLTPTLLELGGKSPLYVDKNIHNLQTVAHRIIWGKLVNGGQLCVAPDYMIVHEAVAGKLMEFMLKALEKQFGKDHNNELGSQVTKAYAQRQVDLLKEVESSDGVKILCGGSEKCDPAKRYVAPALVLSPPMSSRMMKEEIFGPILPIHVVKSKEDAIQFIQGMPATPLSLYVFTDDGACYEEFLRSIPSGSAARNASVIQFSAKDLPLGGLGTSGNGVYHSKFSFDAFTHPRAEIWQFLITDLWLLKFHPLGGIKTKLLEFALHTLPDLPYIRFRRWSVVLALLFAWRYWPDPIVRQTTLTWIATALDLAATSLQSTAEWLRLQN